MDQEYRIHQTLSLIEDRICGKLTVEELAKSAYFSKFHYQRLFKEVVGESVMRYVAKRRITLAAEELAGTDASVLEIALRYGYDSHEGFTRRFRAHTGMTPTEYRRLRSGKSNKKECCFMCTFTLETPETTKILGEITGQLRRLTSSARETAERSRRYRCTVAEAERFYSGLWETAAQRADSLAGELEDAVGRIENIAGRPDGISARFTILRALDEAALQAGVTAFQVGVTMARAQPAHRQAYNELCDAYGRLAEAAGINAGQIAGLMEELAGMILSDMRAGAQRLIVRAVESGREIIRAIPPELPYGYISREIEEMCTRLEGSRPEELSLSMLEDCLTGLDILDFSARVDLLRAPEHKAVFAGMEAFRAALRDAAEFFRDILPSCDEREKAGSPVFSLPAFFLRAELQKLAPRLGEEQKARLDRIADAMERTGKDACKDLRREAEALGVLGSALLYIVNAVQKR